MFEDNVVYPRFGNLDIDPKRVIHFASEVDFEKVFLIGIEKDGEIYAASSTEDKTWLIYIIEKFKHKLLSGDYD